MPCCTYRTAPRTQGQPFTDQECEPGADIVIQWCIALRMMPNDMAPGSGCPRTLLPKRLALPTRHNMSAVVRAAPCAADAARSTIVFRSFDAQPGAVAA